MGKGLDLKDDRTEPLSHILSLLPELNFSYILVENVVGFEKSDARDKMAAILRELNFDIWEFILNPLDMGTCKMHRLILLHFNYSSLIFGFAQEFQIPDHVIIWSAKK